MILEITKEQAEKVCVQNVRFVYFMGGFGSNSSDIELYEVRGRYYLVDSEGKKTEEFKKIYEEQNEEGRDYLKSMGIIEG